MSRRLLLLTVLLSGWLFNPILLVVAGLGAGLPAAALWAIGTADAVQSSAPRAARADDASIRARASGPSRFASMKMRLITG